MSLIMNSVDSRPPLSFELKGAKKAIVAKSAGNKRFCTLRDQQNCAASPANSRVNSAARVTSAGKLAKIKEEQINEESAFDNFLALPLQIHELIFDYAYSGVPLMGQMQRGDQIFSSYFALKLVQLNIRHKALKSEIKKLDQIIFNVSKKTLNLIGINREDRFGELSASSLDSPVKAANKDSNDSSRNPASLSPTEEKTTKTFQKKITRSLTKRVLEGSTTLERSPTLARSKFASQQQILEDKEKKIQRLYYSSLFCLRLHCEKSKSVARALNGHLESNQSETLEAALSGKEQVFYAAAESLGPSTATTVYLLSPTGMTRSAPEQFLKAKEDDVIHVTEESGSYVIIPKQKQIAALLGTPNVCPPTLFERAISGEH